MKQDYTDAAFLFKVRKVARYVRLYGVSRTIVKIRGQHHMNAAAGFEGVRWRNPKCNGPDAPERNVAIVGCGNFAFSQIAYYLAKREPKFLRATYDIHRGRALSLCRAYGGAHTVSEWQDILTDRQVKIVYIASNHATHADYAVACIEAGKHVHVEKPHVVSEEQLGRLVDAMSRHPESKVFLGFNRPKSRLFKQLETVLTRDAGPAMINWAIAGHAIPVEHWYYNEEEGGRVLGNLCHWTDLTLQLVTLRKAFPCTIVPATPIGERSNCLVSVVFGDRSCASITFFARGDTFEGVREVLNLYKGNILARLTDFQTLTIDVVARKQTLRLRHRDHGHEANIVNSFHGAQGGFGVRGEDASYVTATAMFFLAIRRAIDTGQRVTLDWEDIERALVPSPMQL